MGCQAPVRGVDGERGGGVGEHAQPLLGGMVRHDLELFGGGAQGVPNVGMLAPGSCFTVDGVDRHTVDGFSIIHSLKEVSRESDCCIRFVNGATDVPEPGRCTIRPSFTSSPTAFLTVTRETSAISAISRSDGRDSPAAICPERIDSSMCCRNCA